MRHNCQIPVIILCHGNNPKILSKKILFPCPFFDAGISYICSGAVCELVRDTTVEKGAEDVVALWVWYVAMIQDKF